MADDKVNKNFTPTGPAITQDFTPAGPPISTVTGKPEPTPEQKAQEGKEVAAGAVRYGAPITAGLLSGGSMAVPSLVMQALTSAGSEFAARKIERASSDPELDTMMMDLKASGITGVLDLGVNLATKGIGSAFHKIGKKLFIPSEIPLEVRIAQETLGSLPPERIPKKPAGPVKRFLEWTGASDGKRPFSLTAGQINGEEQRFITTLESMARSGFFGRGKMTAFDARNKEATGALIEKYLTQRASEATAPEFSLLVKRTIGDVNNPGEIFEPVVAFRKYLYKQFDDALEASGGVVDGSSLRTYIQRSGNIAENLPNKIYSQLRAEGLVPPLSAPSTSKRTITNIRTKKIGEEAIDKTQDITKTNLLTGDEKRIAETAQGTRAQSTSGTSQTIRETETIQGMTEEELAQEWANLPAADVDKIIKTINSHWKDGDMATNNTLKKMRVPIETPYEKLLDETPGLRKLRADANTFFGKEKDFLENKTILGLKKAVSENPSKLLHMLGGDQSPTSARNVYDNLMNIKKAFKFAGETAEATADITGTQITKKALQETWDKDYLLPIRYDMISKSRGKFDYFDPNKFLSEMQKNSSTPEFMNEVFGGPKQVEEIKNLMTTLSILEKDFKQNSIFIQLAQAGQVLGGVGGIGAAFFSDTPEIQASSVIGGAAILLGPNALAKMLTNPELTRSFTDGLKGGLRSGKFGLSLRKIAQQAYGSTLLRENPSKDKLDFYTTLPPM